MLHRRRVVGFYMSSAGVCVFRAARRRRHKPFMSVCMRVYVCTCLYTLRCVRVCLCASQKHEHHRHRHRIAAALSVVVAVCVWRYRASDVVAATRRTCETYDKTYVCACFSYKHGRWVSRRRIDMMNAGRFTRRTRGVKTILKNATSKNTYMVASSPPRRSSPCTWLRSD